MYRNLIVFFIFLVSVKGFSQELRAQVVINAQQTAMADLQVFKTLERELTEFINETKWTNMVMKTQERIECNMVIIVNSYNNDNFSASLQIQASRPVFGSSYSTTIYNFNDRQFDFTYREFQPLNFNPNVFSTNLISVIAFHVYTIIGLDASTFSPNGGDPYFEIAKQIVNTASSSNFAGWKATDGQLTRYQLNDALLSPVFSEFHTTMYEYHRKGLDLMHQDPKQGKSNVAAAVNMLKKVNDTRPNSFLLRTFFDAKAEEIEKIFSDGPSVPIDELVQNLNRISPTKRSNWQKIRF
ncbi:MAG TPA: DUF4835 family protein [Flavobacteriaceae bacterium]|nr:DUF4835 family protein [Flavobacteriaceae bacterium]